MCVVAFGAGRQQDAVPVLEKFFEKVQDQSQAALADVAYNNITVALTMLGQRAKVLEILHKKLIDKSVTSEIKQKVLHGIGYAGDETSLDVLVDYYKDEKNEHLKSFVIMAMGFILDKNKISPLYKIVADGNPDIPLNIMIIMLLTRPD